MAAYFPGEHLIKIYSYLSTKEVLEGNAVCSLWRNALESSVVWRRLCYKDFNLLPCDQDSSIDPTLDPDSAVVCPRFTPPQNDFVSLTDIHPWRVRYMQQAFILKNWIHGRYVVKSFSTIICRSIPFPMYCDGNNLVTVIDQSTLRVWETSKTMNELAPITCSHLAGLVTAIYLVNGVLIILYPDNIQVFESEATGFVLKHTYYLFPEELMTGVFVGMDFDGIHFAYAIKNCYDHVSLLICDLSNEGSVEMLPDYATVWNADELWLCLFQSKLYIVATNHHSVFMSFDLESKSFKILHRDSRRTEHCQFLYKSVFILFKDDSESVAGYFLKFETGIVDARLTLPENVSVGIGANLLFFVQMNQSNRCNVVNLDELAICTQFNYNDVSDLVSGSLVHTDLIVHKRSFGRYQRWILRNTITAQIMYTFPKKRNYEYVRVCPTRTKLFGLKKIQTPSGSPEKYCFEVLHYW